MGLLEYLETFITAERKQKFIDILQYRSKHFTVVIEDVYQLHNTSAVMRSCEVFGVQQLHVIEQRFGKQIDKQIAMGAQKWVDIIRHQDSLSCIDSLRQKGYQIIATTPHNDSVYLEDFDISKPSTIFFGTEKEGLSDDVLHNADGFLKIPMIGFTESLNVSVSAAIIIQNLMQRLRASKVNWKLSGEEILEKRLDWTRKSIKDIDFIEKRFYEERL
ncbi:MAG: TrmH family RNA methyltransferase [Flavobacteriaceae bacterium]